MGLRPVTFTKKTSVDEKSRRNLKETNWLVDQWFNDTFNNFSVMLGQSHRFLGMYQYFGELKASCSRTLHGDMGVDGMGYDEGGINKKKHPSIPHLSYQVLEKHVNK